VNDHRVSARHQGTKKSAAALRDLIDDNATVHDHGDPTRAPALVVLRFGVEREREEGDIDAGRLPSPSRKVQHAWPTLLVHDQREQALLPHKWLLTPMAGGMECAEIRCVEVHRSSTGRQSPSPK